MSRSKNYKVVDVAEWKRIATGRKAQGRGSMPLTPEHMLSLIESYEQMYERVVRFDELDEQHTEALETIKSRDEEITKLKAQIEYLEGKDKEQGEEKKSSKKTK